MNDLLRYFTGRIQRKNNKIPRSKVFTTNLNVLNDNCGWFSETFRLVNAKLKCSDPLSILWVTLSDD